MTDKEHIFLNSIAYIANRFDNRTIDFHKLSKILYFAEKKHLVRFGSKLIDDSFIAMKNGPVPSQIYDLLKGLKIRPHTYPVELNSAFKIDNEYMVISLVDPDMDWLSESEIICIEESINEIGYMGFDELSIKSHDSAWNNSQYTMKTEHIALAGGANESMLAYISRKSEETIY